MESENGIENGNLKTQSGSGRKRLLLQKGIAESHAESARQNPIKGGRLAREETRDSKAQYDAGQ